MPETHLDEQNVLQQMYFIEHDKEMIYSIYQYTGSVLNTTNMFNLSLLSVIQLLHKSCFEYKLFLVGPTCGSVK